MARGGRKFYTDQQVNKISDKVFHDIVGKRPPRFNFITQGSICTKCGKSRLSKEHKRHTKFNEHQPPATS